MYPQIWELYRYLSAFGTSVGGYPFMISSSQFINMVKKAGLLKNKGITLSDTDTIFLTIKKKTPPTPLCPGTGLIRFEFVELMMRLTFK